MAAELVSSATSSKLTEMDWSKNIEICSLVAHDHRQAKDVVKAIKKRLASKNQNTQLFAVLLLEMLMNNIGESVHKQVIDTGILPILVKVVMKKSDHPARERIFLLLDAAQTSLGGASGRFPQYYVAYYELVSAGVQFPQRPRDFPRPNLMSKANKKNPLDKEPISPNIEKDVQQAQYKKVSEARALQKACAAIELLRDVVNTIDTQNPEGAKDEFTLDLVEQCSFAKQRVMHLAVTSLDVQIVLRAVEINEQLGILLRKHDALLDRRPMPTLNPVDNGHELKEEEAEQLYRRIQKGKACMRPEDEEPQVTSLLGLMSHSIVEEMLHRPLIRPLRVEAQRDLGPKKVVVDGDAVAIPPPPAKHVEREKFFEEIKATDVNNGHMMRSLSLHSRNASSSRSASTDFSE